ncbi:hypothetical protein [Streptomyces sp. B1I3]|uniref:hypothetical protein n=1 Tax=Streptomyces sp. B1I3 TaxID=3042264 RepID=UPI00358F9690
MGPGRVETIEGWDRIASDPALLTAHLSVREGDVLGEIGSSADRHGLLVCVGRDGASVDETLRAARGRLRVGLAPGAGAATGTGTAQDAEASS